jgi:uncharacterized ferritin-like protein (DUF455 family)
MIQHYLQGTHSRGLWLRMDTAEILKRFYLCERSLIVSQAGWLAAIAPLEAKTTIPRFIWEMALTADALRERVLELRYPSRLIEVGEDAPLMGIFDEALHAPSAEAYLLGLARVLLPSLLAAYTQYAAMTDALADEPSLRFIRAAIDEKALHIAGATRFAQQLLAGAPERQPEAEAWASALSQRMLEVGGVSLGKPRAGTDPLALPGRRTFALPGSPARDGQFHLCRYYWPDIIDATYPYGEGIRLQLRSAVSHFNEVWAVEFGGAVLQAFADELPWEFTYDAARWTYDESRHVRMGLQRLQTWGYQPHEIPLGSYIYDAACGQEPLIRLAMLHYFETKNIGQKSRRAVAFASYADRLSQRDMEFDWADETIHAHYGRHWYTELRARHPQHVPEIEVIRERCEQLLAEQIGAATAEDHAAIRQVADAMIARAESKRRTAAQQA